LAWDCYLASRKQRSALCLVAEWRRAVGTTYRRHIPLQEVLRIEMEGHAPGLAALATAYRECATGEIEVAELQVARLLRSQPYIHQDRQQRLIASTEDRIGHLVCGTHQSVDGLVG